MCLCWPWPGTDTAGWTPPSKVTEGWPTFERSLGANGFSDTEVLRLAASLDQGSEHPLAASIIGAAREVDLVLDKAADLESSTGIGVRGTVAGKRLALGNTTLMQAEGIFTASLVPSRDALRASGASVMYLAVDGVLAGLIAVSDPLEATTAEALRVLRENGIRVVMATGDGVATAKAVAQTLGIEEFHGEVKPADKLALVSKLQGEGGVVAMGGRHQRRARAGKGRRGHRHGNRHRRCHEQRASDPGQARPAGHCACPQTV